MNDLDNKQLKVVGLFEVDNVTPICTEFWNKNAYAMYYTEGKPLCLFGGHKMINMGDIVRISTMEDGKHEVTTVDGLAIFEEV